MIRKINVEQIACIKIRKQRPYDGIKWFPEVKILFGLITLYKEGFWTTRRGFTSNAIIGRDELTSVRFIESTSDIKVEGKECYRRANLEFVMSSSIIEDLFFNSDEEMFEFLEKPEFKEITLVEI